MDQASIETFLAVVRTQSLSRAAERLNVAQTTVSQRLRVLERDVGMILVERRKGGKQVRPTAEGEEFVALAEQWSTIWREARILKERGPSLALSVGAVDSINTFILPLVVRAIQKHDTPVKIKIRTSHTEELYTDVERRTADIAFALKELVHPNTVVRRCFSAPMMVLERQGGVQSGGAILRPTDLNPEHELFMPWGRPYQIWRENWWDPLRTSQIKVDTAHLLLDLLQDSKLWAIVPKFVADKAIAGGGYIAHFLSDPPPDYICYKIVHKQPTSLVSKALEVFDQYLDRRIVSLATA